MASTRKSFWILLPVFYAILLLLLRLRESFSTLPSVSYGPIPTIGTSRSWSAYADSFWRKPGNVASPSYPNVVVGSYVTWHTDIWLSLWSHLETAGCEVRVHRSCAEGQPDCERFLYGQFEELATMGIHLNKSALLAQKQFIPDINKPVFSNGKMANIVLLPTAVQDIADFGEALWTAWEEREADNKFILIVVNHQPTSWPENRYAKLFMEARHLRVLTISEHVARDVRRRLDSLAERGHITQAGSESTMVEVLVPIFEEIQPWIKQRRAIYDGTLRQSLLTRAVISGGFYSYKRDYLHIFQDLERAFSLDAAAWGYRYSAEAKKYVVNEKTGEDTAFQLWMVGSVGNYGRAFSLNVNLTDVVRIFTGPGQREYNDLMMRSDILLPAFLEPGWGYLDSVASGAIQRSLELNIPCLATAQLLEAYTFLDPYIAVVRPTGMSEIEALRVLREADLARLQLEGARAADTSLSKFGSFWPTNRQTEPNKQSPTMQLVNKGWRRPPEAWVDAVKILADRNLYILQKIIAPVRQGGTSF